MYISMSTGLRRTCMNKRFHCFSRLRVHVHVRVHAVPLYTYVALHVATYTV